MERVTVAVVALATILGLAGCSTTHSPSRSASTPVPLSPPDVSAVRAVVAGFAEAWNRHDMRAMHDLNTRDVEWVNVSGNHWCGNQVVYKGHDAIHRTIFAKTGMSVESIAVRGIAPDVAVAVAAMKFGPVVTPSGQQLSELKTRGSFVLAKRDGAWKIAHFQNTTVDAEAEQNDPATWDETGHLPGRDRR